ncbi:hypothetical protein PR048_024780 [Dryococelus australis]|uniref:Armadillo repeat-containing protein 4 n=1 Tax=Dryococelus australis TaxID=614101 RepID=A0ABQ9GPH4_9NEOP|nr:hypothetical protein PR048_024780 [Dryococelus australis]
MKQCWNVRAGEIGDLRENPPTSGIVQHELHMRKFGYGLTRNRTKFAQGRCVRQVDLLDVRRAALATPMEELPPEERPQVLVARAGAKALWSLSQSARNKEAMKRSGVMRLLASLIKSVHLDVVVPIMATIQQCASESKYQLGIRTEGMIPDLVRHLSTDNMELKKHCASAIFKCAEDEQTRVLVRQSGGLDPLVGLAKQHAVLEDKPLLAAVTGAIWKCAICPDNVRRLDHLRTVNILVRLLSDENEEVSSSILHLTSSPVRTCHVYCNVRFTQPYPHTCRLFTVK